MSASKAKQARRDSPHAKVHKQRTLAQLADAILLVTDEFIGEEFTVVFVPDRVLHIYHGKEMEAHLMASTISLGRKNDNRHLFDKCFTNGFSKARDHLTQQVDSPEAADAYATLPEKQALYARALMAFRYCELVTARGVGDVPASEGDITELAAKFFREARAA